MLQKGLYSCILLFPLIIDKYLQLFLSYSQLLKYGWHITKPHLVCCGKYRHFIFSQCVIAFLTDVASLRLCVISFFVEDHVRQIAEYWSYSLTYEKEAYLFTDMIAQLRSPLCAVWGVLKMISIKSAWQESFSKCGISLTANCFIALADARTLQIMQVDCRKTDMDVWLEKSCKQYSFSCVGMAAGHLYSSSRVWCSLSSTRVWRCKFIVCFCSATRCFPPVDCIASECCCLYVRRAFFLCLLLFNLFAVDRFCWSVRRAFRWSSLSFDLVDADRFRWLVRRVFRLSSPSLSLVIRFRM